MNQELNRYIEHLLSISNPVVYAFIITGVVFLMCYIFYFHMFLPQKRQIIKERIQAELKHSKLLIEKFRFLTLELQENIETEKQRLGRELHDSIGQNLLFIKMKASDKFGSQADDLTNVIESTIKDLREITYDLRPRALRELGLPSAVLNLIEYIKLNSAISGDMTVYGNERALDEKRELYLYRVIQETLNNIVKHSGAAEYHIDIDYSEKSLKILVLDDGNGFEIDSPDLKKGSGLLNIEERLKALRGTINIVSNQETGTIVKMEIPYE